MGDDSINIEGFHLTAIFVSLASFAQAAENAMSDGYWWLTWAWILAGLALLWDTSWQLTSRWHWPRKNRIWTCTTIVVVGAGICFVYLKTHQKSIRLEAGNSPGLFLVAPALPPHAKRFMHLRVYNDNPKPASCNVYLIDFTKNGQPIDNLTNTKLVLGAYNQPSNTYEYQPQSIAKGDFVDFELVYIEIGKNELNFISEQIARVLYEHFTNGEYKESILVSGLHCGPVKRTFSINYRGGDDVSLH